MKKMMMLAALLALAGAGCKKKRAEEGTGGPTSGSSTAMGSSGDMGSAHMAGSGGSAAMAPPAKPITPEEFAKRDTECWGFFNDGKWDDFKTCYTADGVSEQPGGMMPAAQGNDAIVAGVKPFKDAFPDMKGEEVLQLVSGHNIVDVVFISGTNTGPMKTPMGEMPPTKAKVGLVGALVLEADDTGKVKHQWDFFDMGELMGQMKPDAKMPSRPAMDKAPMAKETVISKDDDKEKANIEVTKKVAEAFSKHDAKAFGDLLADDVKWSETGAPKDSDKKQTIANAQMFWKAFSDAKITPNQQWAAGDYVATVGMLEATNDGDMPMMKLKKTGKKVAVPHLMVMKIDNGKVKAAWLFEQSMAFPMQLGLMPPPGATPPAGGGSGSAAPKGEAPKKEAAPKAEKKG
jgi:predicted ester cyclase